MKNIVSIVIISVLVISNVIFAVKLFCGSDAACGAAESETVAAVAATPVDPAAEKIELVAPTSDATLLVSLQARSSVRSYAADALSLEQLSGVMWAAAGENRPGVDGAPGKLTAPSVMALYPIRTYAVLPGGIYSYDAPSHSLTLVAAGDFRSLSGLQDFVYTAPLNIVYLADLAAYGERGASMTEEAMMRLCAMDAAGYCENANLWAAGNGLGAVTRAGANGDAFLAAVNAPSSYRFVLAQTVGVPVGGVPAAPAAAK
jgi:hypothetical protein